MKNLKPTNNKNFPWLAVGDTREMPHLWLILLTVVLATVLGLLIAGVRHDLNRLAQQQAALDAQLGRQADNVKLKTDDIRQQIDLLEGETGSAGRPGEAGTAGMAGESGGNGTDGAIGPEGPPGPAGTATCPNGDCLSLQGDTPGVEEVGHINISGTLIANTVDATTLQGDGNSITGLNASNISAGTLSDGRLSSNVALLDRDSQVFTGNDQAFHNSADSATAFRVQNAAGDEVLTVNTASGEVGLGSGGALDGKLLFYNSSNSNTITLQGSALNSYTLTLPGSTGEQADCLKSLNTTGSLTFGACGGVISKLEITGHSQAYGFGTTDQSQRYTSKVAAMLHAPETNRAINGAQAINNSPAGGGWANVLQNVTTSRTEAPYQPRDGAGLIHLGHNDLLFISSANLSQYQHVMRTMISRYRASAIFEESDASVSLGGTWTNQNGSGNSGSGYSQTSTNGDTYTISVPSDFPGGTVTVGLRGVTGGNGAVHSFTVDGSPAGSLDTRSVATATTIGMVQRFTNLSAGAHTIVGTVSSVTGNTSFDYWQIEAPSPPLVGVINTARVLTYGSATFSPGDSDVDLLNAATVNVVNEFDDSVQYIDIDSAINKDADYFSDDGAHFNDLGNSVIATTVYQALMAAPVSVSQLTNSAAGDQVLKVDYANANLTFNGLNNGGLQEPNTSSNSMPAGRAIGSSVVANGHIYMFGGLNATAQTTVYYAKLNAAGSTGTWTTTTALPLARFGHVSVTANGYIYVMGGHNGSAPVTTVYYAKLNADGTLGSWSTTTVLPGARYLASAAVANGYIYVLGGNTVGIASTGQTTVYYAKLNADGTLGSWNTTTVLSTARSFHTSAVANGYVYVLGGLNTAGVAETSVHYAKLNADGTVGSWSAANTLPAGREGHNTAVANGHLYVIGGSSDDTAGNAQTTIYSAQLNGDGSTDSWTTNTQILPSARIYASSALANGYVYIVGGWNTSAASQATVYYTSTARIKLTGSLDLVGVSGQNLSEGGTGGSLTAGNTKIVGSLEVQDQASFAQGVAIDKELRVGGSVLLRNAANSTTAFQLQNSAGTNLLTVDTTNTVVTIAGEGSGNAKIGSAAFGAANNLTAISLNGSLNSVNYNFLSSPTFSSQTLFINRPSGGAISFHENSGTGQFTINSGGSALFQNTTNSTTAFRIINAAGGQTLFSADTTNLRIGIRTATPQSSLHVADGFYAQLEDNNAGAPPVGDCDADNERGRISIDTANNRLYICNGLTRGWDFIALSD